MKIVATTIIGAIFGLILSACDSDQTASIKATSQLEILAPYPGFIPISPQGEWAISGNAGAVRKQVSMTDLKGEHAMQVKTGERNLVIVRRTQAMLLVTPFLRWDWLMNFHGPGTHPVRLVVGFRGSNPQGGSRGSSPFTWLGSQLPPHDRALSVTWEDSALQREKLLFPHNQQNVVPQHVVRGGRENVGRWFSEFLDLSELYTRAWPKDDFGQVRVMLIGMAVAKSRKPTSALVANVALTR